MSEIATNELDDLYDNISAFVCAYGPKLLTRGMPALEANTALLECLKRLKAKCDTAHELIMELRCHSTGMSVLSEPRVHELVKEFEKESPCSNQTD